MAPDKQLVLWIAGAAGVLLLYSAYKEKSPLAVIQDYTSSDAAIKPSTTATAGHSTSSVATTDLATGLVYDVNGVAVGSVPTAYAGSPGTYIPSGG